ncbi:MAG: hypothetical protein F6K00_15100 [Leptolyngbya sp. SIOISBB]|nr:hypothetical protein [Leptolyngbya sp. SIOISBB]
MMQSVVTRIAVWLLAEVVLTALGTDDIADYGEYVFKDKSLLPSQQLALSEYVCANGICTPRPINYRLDSAVVASNFA